MVEDDEFVRKPLARSLRNLGYTVIEAANGPAALRLLDEQPSPPDLVLSDLVLPGGMGGRDVVEAVLARVPGCKALFMSGYAENAIVHHGRVDEGYHLLHKPYTQDELARKVRDVLDA